MSKDEGQLRLLAISYFVTVGLGVLSTLMAAAYLLKTTGSVSSNGKTALQDDFDWMVTGMYALLLTLALGSSILLVLGGRRLQQHRNRTFCMAVAVIGCFYAPWGFILGIFTIVVLQRESVKLLFDEADQLDVPT